MRITIGGNPGTGTSTLGKALAEALQYPFVSGGDIFRAMAKEKGLTLAEFGHLAESDKSYDIELDKRLKETGENAENIVIESRLAGYMVSNADLRILLFASPECRAARIAEREGISYDVSYAQTIAREASEAKRYMDYYSIDINDQSIYDLIISSETFGIEELFSVAETAAKKLL
ncbi:MAG TPA: AAA family ATPase [Methanocorpusculum sp.]|nr:AAA family ATPase [Methanocorpusculum sp.]